MEEKIKKMVEDTVAKIMGVATYGHNVGKSRVTVRWAVTVQKGEAIPIVGEVEVNSEWDTTRTPL